MAPATPNRPAMATPSQQATPAENVALAEELPEIPMDTDDDEEEPVEIHPSSHEAEVKKLKRTIRGMQKDHDNFLDAAKHNSRESASRIKDLEEKLNKVASLAEALGMDADNTRKLYKEHIEHTAALTATGKDPGEILRPRQPDSYNGDSDKLQGFLTSLRSYQMYYPVQFTTDELRVRHAMGFLKDKALRTMEPIIRDYVNHPYHERKEATKYIYEKYENFEKELTHAFGIMDEKREAEAKIRQLTQKGSAAAYLAEYRYQAAKLDWNEAAHMAQVYQGLKSEVKDAMVNVQIKPTTLNGLTSLIVDIDNRQYERRKEKQASRQGNTYNPSWTRNNHNGNRNHANQGRPRNTNTSYGTDAGPMVIGAVKRDKTKITCWNCGKKGHFDAECKNPVKTNQKYKPVPEGRRNNRTSNYEEDQEPQMAIRSTQVRMCRSGYDESEFQHTADSEKGSLVLPSAKEAGRNIQRQKQEARRAKRRGYQQKYMEKIRNKETWTAVPEGLKEQPEGHTVAMVRKGKEVDPNPEPTLTPEEIGQGVNELLETTFARLRVPQADGTVQTLTQVLQRDTPQESSETSHDIEQFGTPIEWDDQGRVVAVRTNQESGPYSSINHLPARATGRRPNLHYGDPNYLSARRIYEEQQGKQLMRERREARKNRDLWETSHIRQYDEFGNQYWNGKSEKYIGLAKERAETAQDDDVYIRAITNKQQQDPTTPIQQTMAFADQRRYPSHPAHKQLSWMSCTAHYCTYHRQHKTSNDCFPEQVPEHTTQKPYTIIDTLGYQVHNRYPGVQVVQFRAHTETRERALNYVEQRREIALWRQHITTPPAGISEQELRTLDDERLVAQWKHNSTGDPDRGATPDPETLRQWEQVDLSVEQQAADHQEQLQRQHECPEDENCYDSECSLDHPSTTGKGRRHL